MAEITKITVSFGYTRQPRQYEAERADVSLEIVLGPDELAVDFVRPGQAYCLEAVRSALSGPISTPPIDLTSVELDLLERLTGAWEEPAVTQGPGTADHSESLPTERQERAGPPQGARAPAAQPPYGQPIPTDDVNRACDTCGTPLTPGQVMVSERAFGVRLCPKCQHEHAKSAA